MYPYADTPEPVIHTMQDLFGNLRMAPTKSRQTERGELLRYFAQKTGRPIARIAGLVGHLKELQDLYYLQSSCDGYEREGKGPWAKAFFGSLKVRAEGVDRGIFL